MSASGWSLVIHWGGVAAGWYAFDNPTKVQGVIFLDSYPYKSLRETNLTTLSILSPREKPRRELLPDSAIFVEISGSNHAQFGYYGTQAGDIEAKISRQEQRQLTIENIAKFLWQKQ
jgi:pimeloyl-ACP methyl ester carboxylesterase